MTADPETLLSILFRDAADLHLQLSELYRLRDQVSKRNGFWLGRGVPVEYAPGLAGQWDWLASTGQVVMRAWERVVLTICSGNERGRQLGRGGLYSINRERAQRPKPAD